MTCYIHPTHTGHGTREMHPHAHVCFGPQDDMTTQVSVSLLTLFPIRMGRLVTKAQLRQARRFVLTRRRALIKEWTAKHDCHW